MIPGAQAVVERHRRAYAALFREQRDSGVFVPADWDVRFAEVIARQSFRTIGLFAAEVSARFGATFDGALVENWVAEFARIAAETTNATTADELDAAEDAGDVWVNAVRVRALGMAVSQVTTTGNFGRREAAEQAGVRYKRWVVTSNNPRPEHAVMAGQTAEIGGRFSNGARWPGDPALPLDSRAGCSCLVDF